MARLFTLLLAASLQAAAIPAWAQAPADAGPVTDKRGIERRPSELSADPMKAFDIDHDGFLGSAEAKSAAAAHYDGLNPALDDRLSPKQASSILTSEEFRQADTDKDGHLTKAEYLALVLKRYDALDANHDGKVSRKQLGTKAGQSLLKLMR